MLKEHGDDWALHLDPEDNSRYPLRGRPKPEQDALLRQRKRKLSESNIKESNEKKEEAAFFERVQKKARLLEEADHLVVKKPKDTSKFSHFHLFEPTTGKRPPQKQTSPERSNAGPVAQPPPPPTFNPMSVKYMEFFGWRSGEPIGTGSAKPTEVKPIVERQGIGFQDDKKRPHVSLLNKDLEKRFVKGDEIKPKAIEKQ